MNLPCLNPLVGMGEFGEPNHQMLNAKDLVIQPSFFEDLIEIALYVHTKTDVLLTRHPFLYTMERFTALGFSTSDATMLADAYQAVTQVGLWDYLAKPSTPGPDGFMFASDFELSAIAARMMYKGHSGASYAWSLRQMEYIAKSGWEAYANRVRDQKATEQLRHEEALTRIRAQRACPCRAEKGLTSGWCGVAGGGVPACDH